MENRGRHAVHYCASALRAMERPSWCCTALDLWPECWARPPPLHSPFLLSTRNRQLGPKALSIAIHSVDGKTNPPPPPPPPGSTRPSGGFQTLPKTHPKNPPRALYLLLLLLLLPPTLSLSLSLSLSLFFHSPFGTFIYLFYTFIFFWLCSSSFFLSSLSLYFSIIYYYYLYIYIYI